MIVKKALLVLGLVALGSVIADSGNGLTVNVQPQKPGAWSSTPTEVTGKGLCWTEHKGVSADKVDDEMICTGETQTTVPEQTVTAEDGSQVPKSFYDETDYESVYATSHDGRYADCGVVTEDGVTEYLDVYEERCG